MICTPEAETLHRLAIHTIRYNKIPQKKKKKIRRKNRRGGKDHTCNGFGIREIKEEKRKAILMSLFFPCFIFNKTPP